MLRRQLQAANTALRETTHELKSMRGTYLQTQAQANRNAEMEVAWGVLLLMDGQLEPALKYGAAEVLQQELTTRFLETGVESMVKSLQCWNEVDSQKSRRARQFVSDYEIACWVEHQNTVLGRAPSYAQVFEERKKTGAGNTQSRAPQLLHSRDTAAVGTAFPEQVPCAGPKDTNQTVHGPGNSSKPGGQGHIIGRPRGALSGTRVYERRTPKRAPKNGLDLGSVCDCGN